jgi:hypothetical protein
LPIILLAKAAAPGECSEPANALSGAGQMDTYDTADNDEHPMLNRLIKL